MELFKQKFETLNRIEISKSAILNNLEHYQRLNPDSYIFPVLKSNAYGHGLIHIAKILKNKKLEYVCVDSYFEYLKIKNIIDCKTLIIGYNKPKNYKLFNFKKIAITVYDLESIKALGATKKKINVHLKIDTGMNRQGIFTNELPKILDEFKKYPKLNLEGIISHLADADNPDNTYTQEQNNEFEKTIDIVKAKGFNPKYTHLANSAGGLKLKNPKLNAIRLGLGLYGYPPLESNDNDFQKTKNLKPALRLISSIAQVKNIKKGAKVSYNSTFEAEDNMKIAIIPAGYYDGTDRRLSNCGFFTKNSQKLPILGRVCMNITICDISGADLKQNDEIILISEKANDPNSIANIAKTCNTIPYVILVNLSETTKRIIVD